MKTIKKILILIKLYIKATIVYWIVSLDDSSETIEWADKKLDKYDKILEDATSKD